MQAVSQICAAARGIAVMCLVALCGGGAVAQSAQPMRLAALAPANEASPASPTLVDIGPFGLAASHGGAMVAKWRSLQPVISIETRMIDLCRLDSHLCTPAASRFLSIVEGARAFDGRARVGQINRAVNLAIRPARDVARFNVPDVWTTPLMTFALGAGDCEDYAIAKYVALREAGMAAANLRLMIVRDRTLNTDHAVTAARVDGEWLILDNRHMLLLSDTAAVNLTPLVALDNEDVVPVRAAVTTAKVSS
jgi:predicted transglutaminase-like cysteine proteinase